MAGEECAMAVALVSHGKCNILTLARWVATAFDSERDLLKSGCSRIHADLTPPELDEDAAERVGAGCSEFSCVCSC